MKAQSMRVVLLGPANVVHTQRWVEALAERGVDVTLATQHAPADWVTPVNVMLRRLPFSGRLGYFANVFAFARLVHRTRPDLVNVHYASGYGTTAAIVGYRPTLLSVWGSDVYDFPLQSGVAARLVRWNIERADRIASTSQTMADQVRRLVPKIAEIDVTPFGVDTTVFQPTDEYRDHGKLTIGTVKTLGAKYGIDVLIRAFARLVSDPDIQRAGLADRLRLLLVGDGPDRGELERLARDLGIASVTRFVGHVTHGDVPEWLSRLDVYVAPSRRDSESFGVAVVEASSCALPVVVSDAGGLSEVVRSKITGLIVARDDPALLAAALRRLALDADLRARMGAAGREFVQRKYEWSQCVDLMMEAYRSTARRGAAR